MMENLEQYGWTEVEDTITIRLSSGLIITMSEIKDSLQLSGDSELQVGKRGSHRVVYVKRKEG